MTETRFGRTILSLVLAAVVTMGLGGCSVAEGLADLVARGVDRVVGGVVGAGDPGTSEVADPGSSGRDDSPGGSGSESGDAGSEPDGGVSDDGNTPIDLIGLGDCLDDAEVALDPTVEAIYSLDVVDCGVLHDSEVFGVAEYSESEYADSGYPDDDELTAGADDGCLALFEGFTGESWESSVLDYGFYLPSRQDWKAGDRSALCVLYDPSGAKMTGSARDLGV
ncbi:MAG: hypothetical protein RI885_2484 [Actinomycetota bacterium]